MVVVGNSGSLYRSSWTFWRTGNELLRLESSSWISATRCFTLSCSVCESARRKLDDVIPVAPDVTLIEIQVAQAPHRLGHRRQDGRLRQLGTPREFLEAVLENGKRGLELVRNGVQERAVKLVGLDEDDVLLR